MAYFTNGLIQFLKDLENNNNRDWFNENKSRYTKEAKEPFENFIADLIEAMAPFYDSLMITHKQAIFRIYRDVRFSKDKSPYKVQVSALVNPGGRKSMQMPGVYVEISPNHMRVYSGMYQMETKQLRNLRSHIAHHMDEFSELINAKSFVKMFGEVRGEKNKIIPKELREDAAIQPLLYNKQFYYFTEWPTDIVLQDDLIQKVVKAYEVARPLSEFLYEGIQD